jgi:hypothetical protein
MVEIGGKAAQNSYLTHHISVSDHWSFFQARNVRAVVRTAEAELLASLPNAQDPAIQARIKDAQAYNDRMRDDPQNGDGMKQLATQAREAEVERDEAFSRYHHYEYAVGALEIAIVLASVSVVTGIHALTIGAGLIGVTATLGAAGIAAHLF